MVSANTLPYDPVEFQPSKLHKTVPGCHKPTTDTSLALWPPPKKRAAQKYRGDRFPRCRGSSSSRKFLCVLVLGLEGPGLGLGLEGPGLGLGLGLEGPGLGLDGPGLGLGLQILALTTTLVYTPPAHFESR